MQYEGLVRLRQSYAELPDDERAEVAGWAGILAELCEDLPPGACALFAWFATDGHTERPARLPFVSDDALEAAFEELRPYSDGDVSSRWPRAQNDFTEAQSGVFAWFRASLNDELLIRRRAPRGEIGELLALALEEEE